MIDARTLIREKRDGTTHAPGAVAGLIDAYTQGSVPDYQMSAWLMAVYFRGLDDAETFELTHSMLHSGRVLAFAGLGGPAVDKHSTGGVGDKISLPLAPLVAACGAYVPMISGRGLGHTGGTLDKLESIPGFTTGLEPARFERQVRALGMAFGGQTGELAPADGKLYALRDVTATVECIPLIIASILSKKYASGAEGVVFDVKCGRGAFMKDRDRATALAQGLLGVSKRLGKRASALVTRMDAPLGRTVGNALEVEESIAVLKGGGPEDVRELTLALAVEMLLLAGLETDAAAARVRLANALDDGTALERFRRVIEAQGGDARVVDDPGRLPRAPHVLPVPAPAAGFVQAIDGYALGEAVVELGGGRQKKEDAVDPAVGLVLTRVVGERAEAGEPLALVHASRPADPALLARVRDAFTIAQSRPAEAPIVLDRLA
jgi:pyrimidine-nucleoside phosphorylase/thymidine phosphorylase